VIRIRSRRARIILAVVALVAAVGAVRFGMTTYGTYRTLRTAYDLDAPDVADVRPWMTLRYVADTYQAPLPALLRALDLPRDTDPDAVLGRLARNRDIPRPDYVARVQRAVVAASHLTDAEPRGPSGGEEVAAWEELVGGMLVYGYPALGLMLWLGAVGVPLPTALSTAVAGSLAAQGRMDWLPATLVAVAASVLGDAVGYGLGRLVGHEVLERRGRWLGYTPATRRRAELLFERWGSMSILLSRTLVSAISPVVNIVAGGSRFRLTEFLLLALIGRVLWTTAYLALGYGVGSKLDVATEFLQQLTGLLLCVAVGVIAGILAARRPHPPVRRAAA